MPTERHYCPKCATFNFVAQARKKLACEHCGFNFYRNAAAAVAAVIRVQSDILFVVRARNPHKGLLDLPGGFVDPGESLEQSMCRELAEELGFTASGLSYIGSGSNEYEFGGVVYDTCDAFFEICLDNKPELTAMDDAEAICWRPLEKIQLDELAFPSQRQLIEKLRSRDPIL